MTTGIINLMLNIRKGKPYVCQYKLNFLKVKIYTDRQQTKKYDKKFYYIWRWGFSLLHPLDVNQVAHLDLPCSAGAPAVTRRTGICEGSRAPPPPLSARVTQCYNFENEHVKGVAHPNSLLSARYSIVTFILWLFT